MGGLGSIIKKSFEDNLVRTSSRNSLSQHRKDETNKVDEPVMEIEAGENDGDMVDMAEKSKAETS